MKLGMVSKICDGKKGVMYCPVMVDETWITFELSPEVWEDFERIPRVHDWVVLKDIRPNGAEGHLRAYQARFATKEEVEKHLGEKQARI